MNFKVGDRVRVLAVWGDLHPQSPLLNKRLTVCKPGAHHEPGDVSISHDGQIWYVPSRFVEKA
jgi:hypothetical protein